MLDVYICEDEIKQLEYLTDIIQKAITIQAYDMRIVLSTKNPSEIIESIKTSNSTGVYFLDIGLGVGINGLELADAIREYDPRGFVIFITANTDKYKLAFSYNCEAMDYILKDNLNDMRTRIEKCLAKINKRFSTKNIAKNKIFAFKSGDTISYEEFQNIILIETSTFNKHKLSIYSVERIMDFRATLKEISEMLDDRFIRISSSCIVNMDMIKSVHKKERVITLKSGREILISIRCMKPFERSVINRNLGYILH